MILDAPEAAVDYTSLDGSLAAIGANVHRLMQNVRVLDQLQAADAGLSSASDGDNSSTLGGDGGLAHAAQSVADAFMHLMNTAMPSGRDGAAPTEVGNLSRLCTAFVCSLN